MMQERCAPKRIAVAIFVAIAAILLLSLTGIIIIQSESSAGPPATSLEMLRLGQEGEAFSEKSRCYAGWLTAVFSPDDIYQLKFYHNKAFDCLVISSQGWAAKTDANGNTPILHKIPEYIASKGYDRITITPISGDGDYSATDFVVLDSVDVRDFEDGNVIDFEIKQYEIDIDEDDYRKIENKRAQALDLGILLTDDADQVGVTIKADGEKYKADLRLKGDWTDHLVGDQWSLRLDLDGDYCIYGMQKFSLQPIATRGAIWEYLIYEMYREHGGVALRYDFADVFVNGVYKGVYAVEEFMTKRVIEHSQKREGPIVKISEDSLWEHWAYYFSDKIDMADASTEIFSEKKTIGSSTLSDYAAYAITQLNKLRKGEVPVEEVMDIDLYARLHAVLDIFSAWHGRIWHNMRSYYNPITGLLEPIPFDEIKSSSQESLIGDKIGYIDYFGFSKSEEYNRLYKKYMWELSQEYPEFIARHQDKIDQFTTTIRRVEVDFAIDTDSVNQRIQTLQEILEGVTEPTINVEYDYTQDAYKLAIINNDQQALYVTDVQNANGVSIIKEHVRASSAFSEADPLIIGGNSEREIIMRDSLDVKAMNTMQVVYHTIFSDELRSGIVGGGIKLGFYAIGHAYGRPGASDGIHVPVEKYLTDMMSNRLIDFGIFTGDIVYEGLEEEFSDFKAALDATGKRWYVAPGNHDANSVELFEKYIGPGYGYFVDQNNLFIYLDCVDRWDVPAVQRDMIATTLAENQGVDNVFVFTHQLNWWDPDAADFSGFAPNSDADFDYDNYPNFYSEVLPLFGVTTQDVYFIAGDTGAFANGREIIYKEDGRFTYISSGVGGGEKDSAVEFYVMENGQVMIKLIALSGVREDALGDIADYTWKGAQ